MTTHIGALKKGMSITEFLGVKRARKRALLHERWKNRHLTGRKDNKGRPVGRDVPLAKHR